jgi:enoyl-CoA hydratase/carnithine racemase
MASLVLRERRGHVERLTLHQPERRNALSRAMLQQLLAVLNDVEADQEVRVVVLQASGPVFSSGHDLRELAQATQAEALELFELCSQVMERVRLLRCPVIAQVQGLATAAGCQLVASCDLVVASTEARFATPGVRIGLFCTTPAVALARAIPAKAALEMLLTGEAIDASTAHRLGLVNRVVPPEQLEAAVQDLAERIAGFSPEVVALGKKAFYQQLAHSDYAAAYALACPVMAANTLHPAAREGIAAFLEKRPPRWPT